MKTYIISTHFNNINYIKLQHKSIKTFFKGEYNYIVFNDAKNYGDSTNNYNKNMKPVIESTCNDLNIKCINVPQDKSRKNDPCNRCAYAVQSAYNHCINFKDGYLMVIDSDMFFIKDFNIEDYMKNYNIAGVFQSRDKVDLYLWNGLFIMDMIKLPNLQEFNWNCGKVNGSSVDVGGQNYWYLKKYREHIKLKQIEQLYYTYPNTIKNSKLDNDLKNMLLECCTFRNDDSANKEVLMNNSVFHIRGGGLWDGKGIKYYNNCWDAFTNYFNSKITEKLYLNYLNKAISYYHSDDLFTKYFGNVPKTRDITFKYCLDYINNKITEKKLILELGTSRSFTDGRFPGCNSNDTKWWGPNNPEKWDWSAGCFTRFFSELTDSKTHIYTVDISPLHINRCKTMTEKFKDKISYYVTSSENILNNIPEKLIDLLYLDTGDMTPIEFTAQLHLREAKIVVERNILKDDGIILIDDVKSCVPKQAGEISDYGKAKYSIPYFLENGYEIVMGEYQYILRKK